MNFAYVVEKKYLYKFRFHQITIALIVLLLVACSNQTTTPSPDTPSYGEKEQFSTNAGTEVIGTPVSSNTTVLKSIPTLTIPDTKGGPTISIEMLNRQLDLYGVHAGFRDMGWILDGSYLAVASNTVVRFFPTSSQGELISLDVGIEIASFDFSDRRFMLVASEKGEVRIWDITSMEEIYSQDYDHELGKYGKVFFSRDGYAYIFFPATQRQIGYIYSMYMADYPRFIVYVPVEIDTASTTTACLISKDRNYLVIGHLDGLIELQDWRPGKGGSGMFRIPDPVAEFAISEDGQYLAVGTASGVIQVNDLQMREGIGYYLPPPELKDIKVTDMVFLPGSDILIYATSFKEIDSPIDGGNVLLLPVEDQGGAEEIYTSSGILKISVDPSGRYLAIATQTGMDIIEIEP